MNRQRHLWYFFSILCLYISLTTHVQAGYSFCELPSCRHHLAIGPEFYHVKRTRRGGTKQHGYLNGGRFSYDYIGRYLIYGGLEAAYAKGTLRGHTGDDVSLKSHFSDFSLEARLGYTLQSKSGCCAQFIPFLGFGYFLECNDYVHPSPMHVHFRNTFYYVPLGALTRAFVTPNLTIGLNVTAKFSLDGKVKVCHDPDVDNDSMRYENMINCRASVPFCYRHCRWGELCFAPFYEYRHYGHHHNVPFDFLDTKIKDFGFDLLYVIRF